MCLENQACQDVRTEYCWLKNANDRLIAADVQTRAHMIVSAMQKQESKIEHKDMLVMNRLYVSKCMQKMTSNVHKSHKT